MMTFQVSPESQLEPCNASRWIKFNYKEYPELENLTSVSKCSRVKVKLPNSETPFPTEVLVADSAFFSIFDFKILVGNKNTILADENAAVITEDYAQKIFGDKDPIGQEIKIISNEVKSFTIRGIVEKVPSNSSITFDIILPQGQFNGGVGTDFILANSKFSKEAFSKKIEGLGNQIFKGGKLSVFSFSDIYFYENTNFLFQSFYSRFGDKKSAYVLIIIMFIVFAVTTLNFCGFQVIQINSGVKNIGLGKILGIKGRELLMQKTVEIFLLIFLSALVVTIAYLEILPYFNEFTKVSLSPSLLKIIALNLTIIITLFVLAMIYPAIVTFKIPVIESLKGKVFSGNFLVSQKAIVTIQYTLTIASIIASVVIFKQVSFMLHKDMGFNSENIIRTGMYKDGPFGGSDADRLKREADKQKSSQYLMSKLASIPSIKSFALGDGPLGPPILMSCKLKGGEKDYWSQKAVFVQQDYLKVLGLKISEGRFFDVQKDAGSIRNKIVINEAAKKAWGIKDIQKSRLLMGPMGPDSLDCEIIGVVKDFNYAHLSCKPEPLIMVYSDDIRMPFLIKFKEGLVQSGLQSVSKLYQEVNPGEVFNYSFLSDDVAALSDKEKRLSQIYFVFTLLALMITALGIFVIAMHDAQRRTKEIGIRKVNGARNREMMLMLNKDFLKLVFIAFIIACPIAWYALHKWLENFAYKTELSWWVFALAGVVAALVALLTVSWQSWRAAAQNPVEALRYE
jgi:putative ABC transport system permease protein